MWIKSQDRTMLKKALERVSINEIVENGKVVGYSLDVDDVEMGRFEDFESAKVKLDYIEICLNSER